MFEKCFPAGGGRGGGRGIFESSLSLSSLLLCPQISQKTSFSLFMAVRGWGKVGGGNVRTKVRSDEIRAHLTLPQKDIKCTQKEREYFFDMLEYSSHLLCFSDRHCRMKQLQGHLVFPYNLTMRRFCSDTETERERKIHLCHLYRFAFLTSIPVLPQNKEKDTNATQKDVSPASKNKSINERNVSDPGLIR